MIDTGWCIGGGIVIIPFLFLYHGIPPPYCWEKFVIMGVEPRGVGQW